MQFYYRIYWHHKIFEFKKWGAKCGDTKCGGAKNWDTEYGGAKCECVKCGDAKYWGAKCGGAKCGSAKFKGTKYVAQSVEVQSMWRKVWGAQSVGAQSG